MKFFMIGPYYLNWHYTRGLVELTKNLWNFIVFEFHFFSVKDLLLTLLSPFQRLKENYGNSPIDFERIFSALIINMIMRVIGLFVRTIILLAAFICITISFIALPLLLFLWLILPFLLLIFFGGAIWAYFKYRI